MNDLPLISVITVCYNAEKVIAPTIVSVASQTMRDFEHVIVDGASRDDTITVARRLCRENIRIFSEPDEGIYDAMNKGLRLARGEYVIFLNAGDTFYDENTLRLYSEAIKESSPDIIYGDTFIVDAGYKILYPRHLSPPELLSKHSYSQGMLVCHQAFMVRRSIAPPYDLEYRFSSDYDWSIHCIETTSPDRCVYLHAPVALYMSDGTTDRNMFKSLRERFRIMSVHFGLIPTALRHIPFLYRYLRRKKSKQ